SRLLGSGGLLLLDLLRFFCCNARILGRLGGSSGLGLFGLPCAFSSKPRLLLLRLSRFVGGGEAGLFGRDLLQLPLRKISIEPVGIGPHERLTTSARAHTQRKVIFAPHR